MLGQRGVLTQEYIEEYEPIIQQQMLRAAEKGSSLVIQTEEVDRPQAIYESYMVSDEIPTEEVPRPPRYSAEELKAMEEQAKRQFEGETYKVKYPNVPEDVAWEAGQHLDYMFADPVNFWADVAKTWSDLGGGEPSAEYADAIRILTVDSIPLEHYQTMFNMLDLNHVAFVITHIYPGAGDYLNWRWVAGPDNRLEDWIRAEVANMKALAETGTEEEILSHRATILEILKKHRPDFMKHIPEILQVEFIRNVVPELLDSLDKFVIDEKLKDKNVRTMIMWAGGIGGALLLFSMAGRRRAAPQVIIPKG